MHLYEYDTFAVHRERHEEKFYLERQQDEKRRCSGWTQKLQSRSF